MEVRECRGRDIVGGGARGGGKFWSVGIAGREGVWYSG